MARRPFLLNDRFRLAAIVFAMSASITGCISSQTRNDQPETVEQLTTLTREADQKSVVIHSSMGSTDIKNWRVLDSSTMIIETYSHGELLATFRQPCRGLRFSETIGFSTMGPFELDKFTKVLLPDGNWCYIKELVPYIQLESNDKNE